MKKVLAVLFAVLTAPAVAQTPPQMTPEEQQQMQRLPLESQRQLQQMPPELRQQLLKQMGEHQRKREEEARVAAETYKRDLLPKVMAPAPPSSWQERDRRTLADALALGRPSVIVVPPSVPEGVGGIDISARVTMARQLARYLETGTEPGRVPDPGLVFRALGERRSITPDDIQARFVTARLQWVIVGTVQREGEGKMRLSWSKLRHDPGSLKLERVAQFERAGIEFTAPRPPELQLAAHAADAAKALGFAGNAAPLPAITKRSALALPKDPAAETAGEAGTLEGVWLQQLVGALYAPYKYGFPRPQERMFERTLAVLIDLPKEAPDRAVLLARALAYLDRRPAALAVLAEGEGTAEEKALAAYLQSDLPALQAAAAQVKRPVARLLSQLELAMLRSGFKALPSSQLEALIGSVTKPLPEAWHFPVAAHLLGMDIWTIQNIPPVKPVLDEAFPVAGYRLEDLLRGKLALGTRGADETTSALVTISPLIHAQRWRTANLAQLCCDAGAVASLRYRPHQYLDLLEADAERFAMGRLDLMHGTQDLVQPALRLAAAYDTAGLGGDHPALVHQRLMIGVDNQNAIPEGQKLRAGLETFELSRRMRTWEAGPNVLSTHVSEGHYFFAQYFLRTIAPQTHTGEVPPLYTDNDLPMRSSWARYVGRGNVLPAEVTVEAARIGCESAIRTFEPCSDYVKKLHNTGRRAGIPDAIATLIEPRFRGNGDRFVVMATHKDESGDLEGARALLTEAIGQPSASFSAYEQLGQLLERQGRFAEAAKTYLAFPGLKQGARDGGVRTSNYISSAGVRMARHGAPREARPLLEMAGRHASGSLINIHAGAYLALAAGRLEEGFAGFQQAFQRYQHATSAGPIVSLLFAMGHRDVAWNALAQLDHDDNAFAAYRGALTGLRMEARDVDGLLDWRLGVVEAASAQNGGPPQFQGIAHAAGNTALFQIAVMDRDGAALDQLFEKLKGPGLFTRAPSKRAAGAPAVLPNAPRTAVQPTTASFIGGYVPFRKGEYEPAIAEWQKLVKSYDYNAIPPSTMHRDMSSFWAAMTYCAYALAKTGRGEEAQKLPERLTPQGRPAGSPLAYPDAAEYTMPPFDRHMIAGVVAALAGDHNAADGNFRGAQGTLPNPDARMVPPEYQFVEILEMLSKETGVAAYKDRALAFARAYQQFEPWTAWANAFEAQHGGGPQRVRAIGLAMKLDPASSRLAALDPKLLERGRAWLRANDPFVQPARKEKETRS